MGSLMLFILYRVQVRKALPEESQVDFVVVPRMPPVDSQLDPKTNTNYDATDPEAFKNREVFPLRLNRLKPRRSYLLFHHKTRNPISAFG